MPTGRRPLHESDPMTNLQTEGYAMTTLEARLQDWLDWAKIEYDKGDKVKAERLLRHGMQKLCPRCQDAAKEAAKAAEAERRPCHAETMRLARELHAAVNRAQAIERITGRATA